MSRAKAKDIVGRTIVGYEAGLFSNGMGGKAHAPLIHLDNGAVLKFVTEETFDGGEYGTRIIIDKPPQQEARRRARTSEVISPAVKAKIKEAIRLLHADCAEQDGWDRAMRILMPMVGLRRAVWDLDGAKSVPITELRERQEKADGPR